MLSHLITVFMSPRTTMEGIRDRPRWVLTLAVTLVLFAVTSAITAHITGPEQMEAALDGPFGERLASDPDYQRQIDESATPTVAGRVRSGVFGALGAGVFLLIIASLWHLVCRVVGGKGSWKQSMGVILLGDWIALGLRSLLMTPVILAKGESMTVTFSLGALMPEPDIKSIGWRALSTFTDVFSIWALIVTVIGLGVVHAFAKQKAWAVGVIPWLVIGLISLGLTSLFM
jgi:hypothetical protein